MKKIVALLIVAVTIAVCGGYLLIDTALGLNAKSKVAKDVTISNTGGQVSREFNFSSFDKIEVEGKFAVEFTQGTQAPVVISGPSLEMEYLKVKVKGSSLKIWLDDQYYKKYNNKRNGKRPTLAVKLSAPSLRSIEMSLSSTFTAGILSNPSELEIEADTSSKIEIGTVECGSLSVEADTSGSVNIGSVKATYEIEAEADTSGSICLNGVAANAKLEADTSGSVTVKTLTVSTLTAKADTSGSVSVKSLTAENVTGRADTSGDVTLSGKANTVDFRADTGGHIKAGSLSSLTATVGSDTGGKVEYNAKSTRSTSSSVVNNYKAN